MIIRSITVAGKRGNGILSRIPLSPSTSSGQVRLSSSVTRTKDKPPFEYLRDKPRGARDQIYTDIVDVRTGKSSNIVVAEIHSSR